MADDLVQDCIERALRQSAQLRELPRIAGWLRRILYNLHIDEMRRTRIRGKEHDVDELADHSTVTALISPGPVGCSSCSILVS